MKWLLLVALVTSLRAAPNTTCASCHKEQALHQPATAMARAMLTPTDLEVMGGLRQLQFQDGKYSTAISRGPNGIEYSVTDGAATVSTPVEWAFGLGAAGQTYLLKVNGRYLESRASFFGRTRTLDYTLGAKNTVPVNLLQAMGRELSPRDVSDCFGCHATGNRANAVPGLQCEACHAGAPNHAVSISAGKPSELKKLGKMNAEETNEFCGKCHRTWAFVAANGPRGVMNVRFQPYRLTGSKCFDPADRRIACVACHDPHQSLNRQASAYDAPCKTCHSPAQSQVKLCKTGTRDCTGCHMPKYELEGAHALFTDHWIRIVRAGTPYPE